MEPELWERIRPLFAAARQLDPEERKDFLEESAGEDETLRRELESLMAADRASLDFLEPEEEDGVEGREIGPYRVVRRLGCGGVGAVYEAVRCDGEIRRRVAVKLLKRGMDTDEIVRRFRTERQILAGFDHPSIAKLLDGGSTDDGRPYLVMEYVEGQPLDTYCENHRLTVRERLELFLAVCAAVRYAHQNLVVHRDLKPANVLVTAEGKVKLLDFGIAKLLNPDLAAQSQVLTATQLRLMTPDFASPEQVRGETVTTASDVYSLGVILYLLLSGRRPYQVAGGSLHEMERWICEEEPPPLQSVAGRRVERDLENVVAMAMRKEPRRRYASVEQLAAELRNFLDGRPVFASGDSFGYRAGKFLRRHRFAVAAAAVLFFGGLGFVLALTVQHLKLRDALARERFVTEFLVDLFEASDPAPEGGDPVDLQEILDRGRDRLEQGPLAQEKTRARLMGTIGTIYGKLGEYGEAERLLRTALASPRRDDAESAANLAGLGELLLNQGNYEEAEERLREALRIRRRLGGRDGDVAENLNLLAGVLRYQGDLEGAEALYREALDGFRRAGNTGQVSSCLNNLGILYQQRGELDEAEPLLREALALRRRIFRGDHPLVANSLHNLASLLQARGELAAAERRYDEALRILRHALGEEHPDFGRSLLSHATVLIQMEEYSRADSQLREALEIFRSKLGPGHWLAAYAESLRGACLMGLGRASEAEPLLQHAYEILKEVTGPDSIYTQKTHQRLLRIHEELKS